MRVQRLRRAAADDGFTLIELLVVIIILGILAGIAIPVFVSQRTKGYEAADKSDLRNAVTAQEAYLGANDTYATTVTALNGVGFKSSNGVTLSIISTRGATGSTSFCLMAVNSKGGATWYFDNANGGFSKTACT